MDGNQYFECDCIYHRKGFILCDTCAIIVNREQKHDDGSIKVKRWITKPNVKYTSTKNPHRYQGNADTPRTQIQ